MAWSIVWHYYNDGQQNYCRSGVNLQKVLKRDQHKVCKLGSLSPSLSHTHLMKDSTGSATHSNAHESCELPVFGGPHEAQPGHNEQNKSCSPPTQLAWRKGGKDGTCIHAALNSSLTPWRMARFHFSPGLSPPPSPHLYDAHPEPCPLLSYCPSRDGFRSLPKAKGGKGRDKKKESRLDWQVSSSTCQKQPWITRVLKKKEEDT